LSAPPTDLELYSKGLGFGYIPPPDFVAAELNAQVCRRWTATA
jgi:hypothetical protein